MAEFVHQDPVVAVVEVIPERDAVEDLAGGRLSAVPGNVIVTLRTPDGFSVSFGLSPLELLRMWTQGASTGAEPGGVIGN